MKNWLIHIHRLSSTHLELNFIIQKETNTHSEISDPIV